MLGFVFKYLGCISSTIIKRQKIAFNIETCIHETIFVTDTQKDKAEHDLYLCDFKEVDLVFLKVCVTVVSQLKQL